MDEQRLTINALVELQDQFADLYPESPPGARGWVRARRMDEYGYPHVYIEWDKEHWRYRGEADGWAMENHFRPVARRLDTLEHPPAAEQAEAFANKMRGMISEAEQQDKANECPHCGHNHELDVRAMYLDVLAQAEERILEGDGFFIITVKAQDDPDHPGAWMFEPELFSAALTEQAKVMIEAQISHLAALLHRDSTREQIKKLQGEK